ncbi:alanine racemase [Paenibacillus tarimensis]|uniref:alanine racemase n=1 Tax=Paenibacillus tarimensis TaxID=416012 RepID=UPI001F3EC2C6|nr:alanine racemase [Paenibacillus tarimensis]MCF2945302.1 alanine racemase [Paenibacillus tarimensis]
MRGTMTGARTRAMIETTSSTISGTKSGTESGTKSDTTADTVSGTISGTKSGTKSDTIAGTMAAPSSAAATAEQHTGVTADRRPVWLEVHEDHIGANLRMIKSRLPQETQFMAVVKADAYGHGLIASANAVLKAGADQLAVSVLDEAVRLRQHGIEAPILVLTPIRPQDINLAIHHRAAVPVFQAEWLAEAMRYKMTAGKLSVHIKMDTGMGRIGLREREEFERMVPLLRSGAYSVEGVYTHLATADHHDMAYYSRQLMRFYEMRRWVGDSGFRGVVAHCANSAAAMRFPQLAMDMVRVGAALHGVYPYGEDVRREVGIELKPTISLHAEIVHVKKVPAGSYVGYDNSYQAAADEWIATIPVGYADGYFRSLKHFHVLVEGKKAPIAGNVCMDQLMIRLPHRCTVGTKVTLLGRQGDREITVQQMADYIGTIPQEILTHLSARVPRCSK